MAHVGHVDGKFLGVGSERHNRGREDKVAAVGIKRKHRHAPANGKDKLRLRAVDHVAGGQLIVA